MPEPSKRPLCPFYGFHWPADSNRLIRAQKGECGLDWKRHGSCQMETQQNRIDFYACEIQSSVRNLLEAGKHHIRFHAPELPSEGVVLEAWNDRVMRGR